MKAATWPRDDKQKERLLWIDPRDRRFADAEVGELGGFLRRGDLLVVNDASVLPASLTGTSETGEVIEVRLAAPEEGGWRVVAFGAGDWRQKTEDRELPPELAPGARIHFAEELAATVTRVLGRRVLILRFDVSGDALWSALYRHGRPVQYSYTRAALSLFQVQTVYAGEPWASEMHPPGRPLTASLLSSLVASGVELARITHAAGLSSTGDAELDASLPWPERYRIPEETARAVVRTRERGGRVVAVGTTVVRALEGAAFAGDGGALAAGEGVTSLRIGPTFVPCLVDGLFTGIHEPSASHFSLLSAFAPRELLERAYRHAEHAGYVGHEFGDSCLIL